MQHLAGDPVRLAAQPDVRCGAGAAQVEVTVPQPGLLADVGVLVQRERQRGCLTEHLQRGRGDLDLTGWNVRVLVAHRPRTHLPNDPNAELDAQPVRPLGHLTFAEHHLCHA